MRTTVVFDASVLAEPRITGVGRAFLHGLTAFVAQSPHRVAAWLPHGAVAPEIDDLEILEAPRVGPLRRAHALPRVLRALDARLLHSPVTALPLRAHCPMVATVHDVPWAAAPPIPDDDAGGWRQRMALRHAARAAQALVCVSRATRRSVLRALGKRPRAAVRVVPNGVPRPAEPAPLASLRGPLLVLASGNRPRKNLDRVRAAHALARAQDASIPPLEVLGPPDNWVDEPEKLRRLARATALVHVTRLEGFGLPVLEAFQVGVPVLASARGGLADLVRDGAALVVDPDDESAIAAGLVAVSRDAELRTRLAAAGRARGQDLTPARQAASWRRIHDSLTEAGS